MKRLLFPAVLALSGCTGLYMSLPNEDDTSGVDVTVKPITAALVAPRDGRSEGSEGKSAIATGPYVYQVGVGDVLDISVPSIAALSSIAGPQTSSTRERTDPGYTVAPDGTIYLPYVGALTVEGSSIRDVQKKVVLGLSKYIKVPQVTVSVIQFRSQKVLIAGQVPKPGYLPVTDVPLTLVGALTAVGSTPMLRGDFAPRPYGGTSGSGLESGDYRRVRITRKSNARDYDVYDLLSSGDLKGDPLLQDGDVVYVPPVDRSYVYVLGEIKASQVLEITDRKTTLAQVLMTSGGINQVSAKASRVYVIRGQLTKPDVFQLNANAPDALLLADAFQMQPRDVVYVAEANISRWNRFLSQLLPTIQSLLTGAVANTQLSK